MAIDKRFECPDCGQMVLKLGNHGCKATPKSPPELSTKGRVAEQRHLTPKEQQIMHKALRGSLKIIAEPTPSSEVKRSVVKPSTITAKRREPSSTERNRKWREANREKARAYQRDYMRKWRA